MKFLVLLGRFLYSAIFIGSGIGHFEPSTIHYAAAHGVPMAGFLVPLSGVIALLGGVSILLGYKPRLGALLIIIFLIPVTFKMHNFWMVSDSGLKMVQYAMFMKNLALLGAALLIFYFGSGPLSYSSKKK